jgi:diadenylate cyclase
MLDSLARLIERLRSDAYDPIAVIIELLLIGLSVNWCASVLQGTRGTRPLRGVLIMLVVVTVVVRILAAQLQWTRLELLYRYFIFGLAFIALIAFQPELRRAVIRAGDVRFLRRGTPASKLIASLVKAAGWLSRHHFGALIAIQRTVDLRGWAENGVILNAEVSPSLLTSIFYRNSPLHDLGTIIKGNRVVAANCQFPQAESDEVDAALGARHLAAIAMSYETDALVLVVSEETGAISLADTGKLIRYLSVDDLANELSNRLGVTHEGEARLPRSRSHRIWRRVRRGLVVVPLTFAIWYLADQATLTEAEAVKVEVEVQHHDPTRWAQVTQPESHVFSVNLRGSTRAIESLRREAANRPLHIKWTVPEGYARPNQYTLNARQVIDQTAGIRDRGVAVVTSIPADMTLLVSETVSVELPIRLEAGPTRISAVRIEPAAARVTLRKVDLEQLAEEQRFILANVQSRLTDAKPGDELTLRNVPLAERVQNFPVLDANPASVTATLQVAARTQKRRLKDVVVQVAASPQVLKQYRVDAKEMNEWKIDVEVEGDGTLIAGLMPQDVRAYVTVTSDLAGPGTDYRRAPVTISTPTGVTVTGPARFVELKLIPRDTTGD